MTVSVLKASSPMCPECEQLLEYQPQVVCHERKVMACRMPNGTVTRVYLGTDRLVQHAEDCIARKNAEVELMENEPETEI